jgi:hypothetical protein
MSRLPRISPDDLRDLADQERVDRMWARLSTELPVASASAAGPVTSRPRFVQLLIAASLSTFAAGLAVGHVVSGDGGDALAVRATSLDPAPAIDVLAAGSEPRTFVLPSGARVVLEPEALVEVAQHLDGATSLRLMRGAASFDASGSNGSLAILAGEARLAAPAGSVVSVRRNERDADVRVAGGAVEVVSPSGRRLVSTTDGELRVPIVSTVSRVDPSSAEREPADPTWDDARTDGARAEARPSPTNELSPSSDEPAVDAPITASSPSWLQRYQRYEFDEAYRMLEASGGLATTIESAQRASDLMALADIARTKSQTPQAIRALDRVVSEFPSDPNATVAAMTLGRMHESMGNRDLAARYFAQAGKSAVFEEDVLCRALRAHASEAPPSAGLVAQAKSFLAKFPDGSCRELAESIVSEGADGGSEPEDEAPSDAPAKPDAGGSPGGGPAPAGTPSAPGAPSGSDAPAPAAPSASANPSAPPR